MMKVALTGNYGMGKSSVAAMFSRLGALTIDSDEIVDSLLNEESVKGRIMGLLGVKALDPKGSLDKKYIAQRVFTNKALRKELEALIHPLVFHKVECLMKKVRDRNRIIIVEVPLLFEGGYQNRFDRTITVCADRKTALSRLRKSGISQKDALARLRNQMDIRTKKRLADYRIENSGTRRQTEAQVREIYSLLVNENERVVSKGQRRS
jgi:dephospho-CoA kinase